MSESQIEVDRMWFVVLSLFIAVQGHASPISDKSCLDKLRDIDFVFGDDITKLTLSDRILAALPRKDEQYSLVYGESRKTLKQLEYSYEIKYGGYRIERELDLKALPPGAEAHVGVRVTTKLYKEDFTPVVTTRFEGGAETNCQVHAYSVEKERFSPDPTDAQTMIVARETTEGEETQKSEERLPLSLLRDSLQFSSLKELDKLPFLLAHSPFHVYAAPNVLTLRAESIPARRHYNPIANRVEDDQTSVKINYVADKFPEFALDFFEWSGSQGFYSGTSIQNNEPDTTYEAVTREIWQKSYLPTHDANDATWTWGFSSENLTKGAHLAYRANVHEFFKIYPNYLPYFTITDLTRKNGNLSFVVLANKPAAPKALPWNLTDHGGSGQYLESTANADLEDVKDIAEAMRPSLAGMDRLQVSRAIIRKVAELISTDSRMANLGGNEVLTLKQILARKKGVCHHYAALFQGLARNLGIPTRVIVGDLLAADRAGLHAWIEVNLDGKTWWPLDPQMDSDSLPGLRYFPMGVYWGYEAHDAKELEEMYGNLKYNLETIGFKRLDLFDELALKLGHDFLLDFRTRARLLFE